ncbi:MAG: cation-transporting P-type ATPase [Gammaproteobacteria bacterium]|nr:cation-transporting P-type ATPase [Gammaproteobacteria bacterium]MBQ0840431.1 cation-transporting P-type ATPase [Gammaproteobacteria bacterium]
MNENIHLWHNLSAEEILAHLDADTNGLSSEQANQRLTKYGPNALPEPRTRGPLRRFAEQFHNVLIYVLLLACAVTALLGHWLDASVIFGVVLANAVIGFVQEGKAFDALQAIRQLLSPQVRALRDGVHITIAAKCLVPGDIVLVQSGDKIAADLRLIHSKNLEIEEAALTGESIAVTKSIDPVAPGAQLGDRHCMAYSSTLVVAGQGSGVVVGTGRDTEIGRISSLVAGVELLSTPLLQQISAFSRTLTLVILATAMMIFVFGVWVRDYPVADMFLAVVGLSVAAIPEGLPAIITITLAIGVQRMVRHKAIIRRLPAVETLGAVSVICADKTGTLTRNEMTVRSLITAAADYHFDGSGYQATGNILLADKPVDIADHAVLASTLQAAVLCNDASIAPQGQTCRVHGDPMEGALLVAGVKGGLGRSAENQRLPRLDLIPFESEHKFMATLHQSSDQRSVILVKGAPEKLLEMCKLHRGNDGDQALEQDYWQTKIIELATQGQRVLAVAAKPLSTLQQSLQPSDLDEGLVLLGLFGLIDPPRREAIESLRHCHRAGIEVKMITGDHAATASAIARQLGFRNADAVLSGRELSAMSDEELRRRVREVDIYARVSPEHKLRLVRLLQEQGLIVAMTGDGVNDAPALKRADVGIAMGLKGTEAAKEAAEMVLTDDNFSSIVAAVEEGRTVYDNLRKAILFILPTSGGEALIIIAAIVFGFQHLPLTPVQILWVNMVTTVTLALALSFEPGEAGVMRRLPRPRDQAILSRLLLWRVFFVSAILMSGTFGLFLWDIKQGNSIEHSRTVAVNTLVLFECFYLFNSRYISDSVLSWQGFSGNRWVLIAIATLLVFQLGFTYLQPMQTLFGTEELELRVWGITTLVAASVFVLVELEKFIMKNLHKPEQ